MMPNIERCVPFWDGERWWCPHPMAPLETDQQAENHYMVNRERT